MTCYDSASEFYKKKGQKVPVAEVKCDVCNEWFKPIRWNVKRCSDVCRYIKRRDENIDRWANRKKLAFDKNHAKKVCAVCLEEFRGWSYRVTCGKECANEYSSYAYKIRLKPSMDYSLPFDNFATVPMPEHHSINVGKIDMNSSEELAKATKLFIENGGQIRKFKDDVGINLLKGNPLGENELQEDDIMDQLTGNIHVN